MTGMFAALCLLPFVPDSRPLAAVVGGALGLLLGSVLARAVLRALGVDHRLRASSAQRSLREIVKRRIGALAALCMLYLERMP